LSGGVSPVSSRFRQTWPIWERRLPLH
jgi:hypothetical protein